MSCAGKPKTNRIAEAKEIAKKIRLNHGTVRDLLRKKQFKESKKSREVQYDKCRESDFPKPADELEDLEELIKSELSAVVPDTELNEMVYGELVQNWLVSEWEKEEQYMTEYLCDSTPVFCPVCQKSCLEMTGNTVQCPCGVKFLYNNKLQHFLHTIHNMINMHSDNCPDNLGFVKIPSGDPFGLCGIDGICTTCQHHICLIL